MHAATHALFSWNAGLALDQIQVPKVRPEAPGQQAFGRAGVL